MKLIMKRAVALVGLSLCAVLSACSGTEEQEEQSSPQPSSQEVSSEAAVGEDTQSPVLPAMQEEIITFTAYDGLAFQGKLRMPEGETAEKLVIYVNGSGPNTYDNQRQAGEITFNYHDLFAEQFTQEGIAYFSYNTRGVTPGGCAVPCRLLQ